MKVLDRPVAAIKSSGIVTRGRVRITAVLAFLAVAIAPVPAFATTPTDPTSGAAGTLFSTVQDFFVQILVPLIAGLLVVTLGVALSIKWVRRMAKQ